MSEFMASEQRLMLAVVEELQKHDVAATVEYPGYIGLQMEEKLVSFGTANGTWGWSDEYGRSGESELPGSSSAQDIAKYILAVILEVYP